jgi:hypothetical protein
MTELAPIRAAIYPPKGRAVAGRMGVMVISSGLLREAPSLPLPFLPRTAAQRTAAIIVFSMCAHGSKPFYDSTRTLRNLQSVAARQARAALSARRAATFDAGILSPVRAVAVRLAMIGGGDPCGELLAMRARVAIAEIDELARELGLEQQIARE